jgi:hypothetical protein
MTYLPTHQGPAHCTSPLAHHPNNPYLCIIPIFSGLAALALCNLEDEGTMMFHMSATVCWLTLHNMSEDLKSSVLPL